MVEPEPSTVAAETVVAADPVPAVSLSARAVAVALGVAVVGISAASYGMHLLTRALDIGTVDALDVGDEVSVGTWFQTTLFLVIAVVLLVGARRASTLGEPVRAWVALAVIMVGLSLDEAVSLHEKLGRGLRSAFDTTGLLYYVWVIPALVFVALVVAAHWRWLRSFPPETQRTLVMAGAIFVLGAAGFELLAATGDEADGTATLTSVTLSAVEELLEMAGLSIFLVGLLGHLDGFALRVGFGPGGR